MALTPEQRSALGRIAVLHRHNPQRAAELNRDYKVDQLAEFIDVVVNASPPITDEQRAMLAAKLAPPQGRGGDQNAA